MQLHQHVSQAANRLDANFANILWIRSAELRPALTSLAFPWSQSVPRSNLKPGNGQLQEVDRVN